MRDGGAPKRGRLVVLSLDARRASPDLLSRAALRPEERLALLRAGARLPGLKEACVLSTCQRVEFYLVVEPDSDAEARWMGLVRAAKPDAPIPHPDFKLDRFEEDAAAEHLMRVACGLESSILGDAQVPGQARAALTMASEAGTLGPVLSELFREASEVSTRARATTGIARGTAGLGAALHEELVVRGAAGTAARILVLGAGQAAAEVLRHLVKRGLPRMTVLNRTYGRASALAAACGARAARWEELDAELRACNILISAVHCDAPVLGPERLDLLPPDALIFDLSVPRSLGHPGERALITMAELARRQEEARHSREDSIDAACAVVAEGLSSWRSWRARAIREKVLKDLFLSVEQTRLVAAERLSALTPGLDPALVSQVIKSAMAPELRKHARRLREIEPI